METAEKKSARSGTAAVRRDRNGRFRDAATGRFVSAAQAEALLVRVEEGQFPADHSGLQATSRREHIQAAMQAAAKSQGYSTESFPEVVARLIGVQTEIALNKDDPARATAAANYLSRNIRLIGEEDGEGQSAQPWFILGRELAGQVLALVEAEQARRAAGKESAT